MAVIYIAQQGEQPDREAIVRRYNDGDIFVLALCGLDRRECSTVSPAEVLGEDHVDYAFCLKPDELICYAALKASLYFLNQYPSVVVLSGRALFPPVPGRDDACSAFPYVLDKQDENNFNEINLSMQPLYCNDSFALKGGAHMLEFLRQCEQKYKEVVFGANDDRGFLKTWLSYASLFGCRIDLAEGYPVTDLKGECGNECFEDGTAIPDVLREYYGIDYRLRRKCAHQPFSHSEYFMHDSVIVGDTYPVPMTAIEMAVYHERKDLQAAFADIANAQVRMNFAGWFLQYAQGEYDLQGEWIDSLREAYDARHAVLEKERQEIESGSRLKRALNRKRGKNEGNAWAGHPSGVNLCGFIQGDFGLGESMRILARILGHAGIPYTIIEVQDAGLHTFTNTEFEDEISNEFRYDTNIFAYNPDCFEDTIRKFDRDIFKNRRNVGYWAWEMPEFPDGWEQAFPYFDEIWTCSDFTTKSIAQRSPIPVSTVPYAISPEKDDALTRQSFGLPEDRFIFLLTYDTRSISERKNPMAAIAAFRKAFEGNGDVRLLIKLNTPLAWVGDDELADAVGQSKNIDMIARQMSKTEINSLISLCDAYLSLHRSEGFGLGPAEAMAFGKPAVLTDFGGNTQYMRNGACCPVPYRLVEIEKDFVIYKKGMHWAEADVGAAVDYMKRLVENVQYRDSVGENAKRVIETEFSYEACGKIIRERLAQLGEPKKS